MPKKAERGRNRGAKGKEATAPWGRKIVSMGGDERAKTKGGSDFKGGEGTDSTLKRPGRFHLNEKKQEE